MMVKPLMRALIGSAGYSSNEESSTGCLNQIVWHLQSTSVACPK